MSNQDKALNLKEFIRKFLSKNTLVFTKNGNKIGRSIPIPYGVNDLHVHWKNRKLISVWWSKDGVPYGNPISIPLDANDLHLNL